MLYTKRIWSKGDSKGYDIWKEANAPNTYTLLYGGRNHLWSSSDAIHFKIPSEEEKKLVNEYIQNATEQAKKILPKNHNYRNILAINSSFGCRDLRLFQLEIRNRINYHSCFDCVKLSGEIIFYIPEWLLDLYGYTKLEFEEYLNFIKGIEGLNFEWSEKEAIENQDTDLLEPIYTDRIMFPKHKVYRYVISDSNSYYNYIRSVIVRYALHYGYNHIAAYSLIMREQLPKEITNSEILLLAHHYRAVDDFYALAAANPLIKQSFVDIVKSYSTGKKLNSSVEYMKPVPNAFRYFEEGKFEELYNKLTQ